MTGLSYANGQRLEGAGRFTISLMDINPKRQRGTVPRLIPR
jgi:hypothetical protein